LPEVRPWVGDSAGLDTSVETAGKSACTTSAGAWPAKKHFSFRMFGLAAGLSSKLSDIGQECLRLAGLHSQVRPIKK